MRHRKKTIKLGRTSAHREALIAGLVCNLIDARRIKTTLPKAKAARSLAEKMVTLGKRGGLAARRRAISVLPRKQSVKVLFEQIAPTFAERAGGYTRILKLGRRSSDSSEMALLEWVDYQPPVIEAAPSAEQDKKKAKDTGSKEPAAEKEKPAKKTAAKKKPAKKKTAKQDEEEG